MEFKKEENYNIALKRLGIEKIIFSGDLSVLTEKELIDMNAELDKQMLQSNQNKINQEALQYLAETDWYILRESESAKQCPENIKIKREEARKKIKW